MEKAVPVVLLALLLLSGFASAENLSGVYTLSSQGVTLTLKLTQDSQGNLKGILSSTTGAQFQVEGIVQEGIGLGVCKSKEGGSFFEAHPRGDQLLLALMEPGPNNMPDYTKAKELLFTRTGKGAPDPQSPGAFSGSQRGPSSGDSARQQAANPLMQQMSGVYYSFSSAGLGYSGGTERQVILCPNGTYYSGSESSYSGGAGTAGAWGAAGRRGGQGTWRVQGNYNEGVLTTIDSNGKPTDYRYRRCGGDCIYIGNTKFAHSTPANCP
ncbi:MAG: hypothetical protein QHH02_06490 [Syntrophomonadaceae bacterium]|nr:hypothetical protein [Syntrophomonadaceae bacterium]